MENVINSAAAEFIKQSSIEMATLTGREYFDALTSHLSQLLDADVVLIAELNENSTQGKTVSIINDGEVADDFEFGIADSPFSSLLDKSLSIFPEDLQQMFPEDYLIADLSLDAFAGVPLYNPTGKKIGVLVALYRQPIEKKHVAEFALHYFASRAASELYRKIEIDKLKEHEGFLFGIIDLIEDVIFITDLQGEIRLISPSSMNFFGLLPKEMTGHHFANYFTEDTRQLGIQEFEKCISSGVPRVRLSVKISDKSGMSHQVSWSAVTTRFNQEIKGCICIIRKVTIES